MSELNKKIKVVMVGGLPSDLLSVKGGVEAVILNLLTGFSALQNIEVAHIAYDKDANKQRVVNYLPNVKVYFVPFKSRFPLLDYLINQQSLRKIIQEEKPDIIHIQESEPHLLRFLNYPKQNIVVTQHGIMREELKYAKGLKDNLKYLFKTFNERFVFPFFKNVIFISEYNRRLFKGQLKNFEVICNPVNPIFFTNNSQSLRSNDKCIIYVGVINRRKNIKLIIEALHKLKQLGIVYQLHVVGGYKEAAFEGEVMEWIAQYDLSKQIIFHGWLKQHEILKVFDQCDYFVLPSLQETLPMSVAEAMALGKIVMATEVGAVSEMFQDRSTGFLFQRDDVEGLVRLLKGFADGIDPNLKFKIKKEAKEKYDAVEVARRTVRFYEQVLSKS
jgi:glycosyltransferase involved in cell wall biosynthesis